MITPDYATTMARYNRWQNRSLVAAADTLSEQQRWQDRGAYFSSIAKTLNHILWDDRVWLARLQGDAETAADIGARHPYTDQPTGWADFTHQRQQVDDTIVAWANTLTTSDLASGTDWVRGGQPVTTNFGFNVVHMFNHQAHHRGQVHAMLTAAGAKPEPTDLQMLEALG